MAIGKTLRQARETRTITLEEAECITKIRRKYLEALENEQFHVLPDRAYARCFLSTYSRFLGLNSTNLIRLFDLVCPAAVEDGPGKTAENSFPKQPAVRCSRKMPAPNRLSPGRDVRLVVQIRNILAAKKKQTWWMRRFGRLLTRL
ncbi:MAG: helix-turn-helix domain-containing protein [Peptococcaceae bacterium]|nr:helix-turn-helix domain-containing protein [Peptococcaceae bacterium]